MLFKKSFELFNLILLFMLFKKNECKPNDSEHIHVELLGRKVLGLSRSNWLGDEYFAFRGIPYAKSPVAERRFKRPEPLDDWPDVIDARYDGHDCPSIYATNASEDCLNLNVYSSNLTPNTPLPVIVFIHPGGLYVGSGLSSLLDPIYLLTKPIVLVTFNYRLGTLGFLQLENADISGNAGFKDQVLALQWVRQHIVSFGGNSADVTLMGYSAGGLSITQHLVSEMSVGLFHKAIAMSGSMLPQATYMQNNSRYLAIRQAKLLNCTLNETPTDDELLACLNRFSGTQIAATLRGMFEFGKDNPMYLWLPQVERNIKQTNRFLTEPYIESLKAERFHKLPVLFGFTHGEFCTSVAEIIANNSLETRFYDEFEQLAPTIFMYATQPHASTITAALKRHYLANSSAGHTNFSRVCDLFSDALIRFGFERMARLLAPHTSVYSYQFDYVGEHSNLEYKASWGKARTDHMDDLAYLFRIESQPIIKHTTKDAAVVQLYVNFMYEFVKNGRITATKPYPAGYTLITDKIQSVNGTNFAEAAFWEQLIP